MCDVQANIEHEATKKHYLDMLVIFLLMNYVYISGLIGDILTLFYCCLVIGTILFSMRFLTRMLKYKLVLDRLMLILLVFTAWVGISRVYSSSSIYAAMKLREFLVVISIGFLIRGIVANRGEAFLLDYFKFIVYMNIAIILASTYIFRSQLIGYVLASRRLFLYGNNLNPIWYGRIICETILGIFILNHMTNKRRRSLPAFLLLAVPLVVVSGSKGPVVSLLVAFPVFKFLVNPSELKIKRVHVVRIAQIIIVATLLVVIVINVFDMELVRNRFFNTESLRVSQGSRMERILFTIETSLDHVMIGAGLGSWASLYGGHQQRDYVHNILLELLSETGLIGVVIFCLLFINATVGVTTSLLTYKIFYSFFVYNLVNSMFSGDLPANRGVFIYLSILSAIRANIYNAPMK